MSQKRTSPARGQASAPVWEVWPFKLELLIPEREFQEKRARIRMKAGYTPLQLVADAMREERRWHDCTASETAKAAQSIADALRLSPQDRALLGV